MTADRKTCKHVSSREPIRHTPLCRTADGVTVRVLQ
jgi:hypothetical protein